MEARAPGASVVARDKEKFFWLPFDVVGSDCLLEGEKVSSAGREDHCPSRPSANVSYLGEFEFHGAPTPTYVRHR